MVVETLLIFGIVQLARQDVVTLSINSKCKDVFCAVHNEVGDTLANWIRENTDYTKKELHGCILDGELLSNGQINHDLYIGKIRKRGVHCH